MDFITFILPVLLYTLAIILLIVLIILGIKMIFVIDRTDRILGNIEEKVNSLNGVFTLVDKASDSIAIVGDTVITAFVNLISKVFNRKKNEKEEDYYG